MSTIYEIDKQKFDAFVARLPDYYDRNKIQGYQDGYFRMNVPGLHFNNRNWPHIRRYCCIYSLALTVGYPLVFGVLRFTLPVIWAQIELYVALAVMLGGLFVPIYAIGKKYE